MSNLQLTRLSQLIKKRNQIDQEIASLIGYPALDGHIGAFIATVIFEIMPEKSASHKGSDGRFIQGPLAGRTVNIKWSGKHDGLLNLTPDEDKLPGYYLVMRGPRTGPISSRGTSRPWCIESVFLFNAHRLVENLRERSIRIDSGTSVRRQLWDVAEIYPSQCNRELILTEEQRELLALFHPSQVIAT